MQSQIKVLKADGSNEEYLYTKVMSTINSALMAAGHADTYVAEKLADVVTYYLYQNRDAETISSSEIFSIIEASLATSGYECAAAALSEQHYRRKLKRKRTKVAAVDVRELGDAEAVCIASDEAWVSDWDKSHIIAKLQADYALDCQTARTIASTVEEKILNMGLTVVPASLIKQVVLNDTALTLRARRQLQT